MTMGNFAFARVCGGFLLGAGLACFAAPQRARADVTLYPGSGVLPSVEVYLRLDGGWRFVNNVDNAQRGTGAGSSNYLQRSGNDWGTSMFGVQGASQLTQNLQAIYRLESGFDASVGQFNGGRHALFNRRAYIGLKNGEFGSIMVGKDLFIDNDAWNFDPMVQEYMSTPTLVYGRNWGGANNMVEYRSPDWGGLQIGLMASFNNGDGDYNTRVTNAYGASVEYDVRKLSLYGIYDEVQDQHHRLTNLYSSSREGIFGAIYDLNPVKIYAAYSWLSSPDGSRAKGGTSIENPGAADPVTGVYATRAALTWLGAVWTVTPKLTLRSTWYHTVINDGGGSASLYTAGTEYHIDKHVFLYLTVGELVNKGKADFSADLYSQPPAPGKNQFSGFFGASVSF